MAPLFRLDQQMTIKLKRDDALDESTRPHADKIEGVTPRQRAVGGRLAMIHAMHINALDETKEMMERVEAFEISASDVADKIASLELVANYRDFGNLCGRECQFLNFHHAAEDTRIFPILLRKGDDSVKLVVERLMEEHAFVHRLLIELDSHVQAIAKRPDRDNFIAAKEAFRRLYDFVRSHFRYEETQLEEALGVFDIPL